MEDDTNADTARNTSRQPVQARSVATRAALLDAAVECLWSDGYAAVTTTDIARRAGVSRGALLHHFPTRAELMAAAVDHVLQRRMREFGEVLADVAPRLDRVDVVLDVLWTMFQGPAFVAWVELWIAARTDPDLAATMVDVDRRFADESRLMFVELASGLGPNDPRQLELIRDFAFAVMTGIATQHLVPRGQRQASDLLDILKAVAQSMLIEHAVTRAQ